MDESSKVILEFVEHRSFFEIIGVVASLIIARWLVKYRNRFDEFWDGLFDVPKTLNELHQSIKSSVQQAAQIDGEHATKLNSLVNVTSEIRDDQKKILKHVEQMST